MIEDAATPVEALALELLRIPSVIGEEERLASHVESWARERRMHRIVRSHDNLIRQAVVTMHSAENRKESRGAHTCRDFPNRDDVNYLHHS